MGHHDHHHQDHHHHEPPVPQKADVPAAEEGQIKVKLAKLGEETKILDLKVGATVAEFVGSDSGLGYIIIAATSYWNAELAFGAMIVLSLMAIILFGLAVLAERLLCPWYISE